MQTDEILRISPYRDGFITCSKEGIYGTKQHAFPKRWEKWILELPFSTAVNYVQICVDGQEVLLPVLYLQHGFGESEISWTTTGKANIILDNLFEMGKIKPFALVMCDGMVK